MGTIIQEGFLSKNIEIWIQENEQKKGSELNLARNTNLLAQSIFLNSAPHGDRGLITATLFARILEHFQAIVLLEERNIANSSGVLLRVLLEATFSLVACVKHDDFHIKLIDLDSETVKKLGKHLQELPPEISCLTAEQNNLLDEGIRLASSHIKTLKAQNAENGLSDDNSLKVKRIAQYAGMEVLYHAIYSILSNKVHSALRDLNGHVKRDELGNIQLIFGPDQPQDNTLPTAITMMLICMEAYLILHPSSDSSSQLQLLLEKLHKIEQQNLDNPDKLPTK